MAQLLRRLRVEMNGAVTGAMQERGVNYPLNYGVSVPTIRSIAAEYAPNHKLARLLYRQQVRELQLASIYIADPTLITAADLPQWGAGVVNSEIAEHLGTMLLSRSSVVGEVVERWLEGPNELLAYTAVLAAARSLSQTANVQWNWVELVDKLPGIVATSDSRVIWHATATFIERLWRFNPQSRTALRTLLEQLKQSNQAVPSPATEYILNETLWLTDE